MIPFATYATLWQRRRHTVDESEDIGCLFLAQVAKFSHVSTWNNENMTGTERMNVHEGYCVFILGNYTGFEFSRNDSAEDTFVAHGVSLLLPNLTMDHCDLSRSGNAVSGSGQLRPSFHAGLPNSIFFVIY